MSDESRYYKIGKDRGADDKSTPLGIFNLADKTEANAAQRGWEAGQSAKEHADAVREALDSPRSSSSTSSSGGGDDPIVWYVMLPGAVIAAIIGAILGYNSTGRSSGAFAGAIVGLIAGAVIWAFAIYAIVAIIIFAIIAFLGFLIHIFGMQ
jgi:hypothetical protein